MLSRENTGSKNEKKAAKLLFRSLFIYISRIFNKSCGYTIIAYYAELKIKEAKKLIREDRYSFAEISNMLCFNNPHYFTRVFKKTANMTPKDYKNSVVK